MDVDFLQRKYFWPSHSLDSLSYFGKTIYTATISNLSSCQTHFMSLARTFTESEHTVVTLAGRDGKLGTQFKLATCYVHRLRGKLGYHSLPPLRINMPCRAEELITVVYFQLCAKNHFQLLESSQVKSI